MSEVKDTKRAYKFNAQRKGAYLELLRQGGRRHASARQVGVTPVTVWHHMKIDPEFEKAVHVAEMEADDEVEDALRMAAVSGNVTATLAWLYSRRPERWRDMRSIKHELSWREEAQRDGYDPDQLFADLVAAARARLDESSGSGGVAGGE